MAFSTNGFLQICISIKRCLQETQSDLSSATDDTKFSLSVGDQLSKTVLVAVLFFTLVVVLWNITKLLVSESNGSNNLDSQPKGEIEAVSIMKPENEIV